MERFEWIDKATVEGLSKRSVAGWLGRAMVEWLLILGAWWVWGHYKTWWVWALCVFVVGTRQHGLGILLHDGSHSLVCRSRAWNDRLTNLVVGHPLFVSVATFRHGHLRHHWFLDTADDPTQVAFTMEPKLWDFPKSKGGLWLLFLRDLFGFSLMSVVKLARQFSFSDDKRLSKAVAMVAIQLAIAAGAWAVGGWETYLLLWLVPLLTVLITCYRIRGLSDHYGIVPTSERYAGRLEDPFGITRTLVPASIVGLLIGPYGVGYHLEHHLYPTVPCYRLGQVHRLLMRHADFRARAHITRGHLELFRELAGGGEIRRQKAAPEPTGSERPSSQNQSLAL